MFNSYQHISVYRRLMKILCVRKTKGGYGGILTQSNGILTLNDSK